MTQEALKMSQEALAGLKDVEKQVRELIAENKALKEALREHAMREVQRLGQEIEQECWCTTCRPITMADMRFVVCPDCGNKRCPKANDHRNACTNSNEVGQEGSSWEHVKPLAQHDSVQAKPEPELCKYGQEPKSCTSSPMDCQCAIDAALAQPEQEPRNIRERWNIEIDGDDLLVCLNDHEKSEGCHYERYVPATTAPPKRTWVGLTDEEYTHITDTVFHTGQGLVAYYKAIEAKLKEKNT